jgi:glutamate synthase (ferredoxin)
MSGGIAYVLDRDGDFAGRCNTQMVDLERLEDYADELAEVKAMIERHAGCTDSALAQRILSAWPDLLHRFVRVIPKDYKRMLAMIERVQAEGLSGEEAVMAAFEMNKNDLSRVSGN